MGFRAGIVAPSDKAESPPLPGEAPDRYALRVAQAKAFSILPRIPASVFCPGTARNPVVIAADTIVVLDGKILGKPDNPARARAMLSELTGKTHSVITGCAILCLDAEQMRPAFHAAGLRAFAVESRVSMWNAPPELIRAYVSGGEPLDKAGAYAVQGAGACFVQSIEGSGSNVVGLPLAELVQVLLDINAVAPADGGAE